MTGSSDRKRPRRSPRLSARAKAAVSDASSGTTLMSVEGLSKSFGGLRAVSNVSFTIGHGEILGIIGPNGAGKTTLFNVLNGVLPADEGTATLAGESMLGKKVHQVCRMGVGRTFQVVRSFPRLPLIDNVIVGAYGAGLSDQAAADEAIRALHRTGLAERAGRPGRATDQQATASDGTGARAGGPSAAVAAGRDTGGTGPRRVRRRAGRAAPPARRRHDDRASSNTPCTR